MVSFVKILLRLHIRRVRRGIIYSIHRVPECLSLRRNWVPPPPPPQASVSLPLDPKGGSNTRLRVRCGGPNSDDWTESMALVYTECMSNWVCLYMCIRLVIRLLYWHKYTDDGTWYGWMVIADGSSRGCKTHRDRPCGNLWEIKITKVLSFRLMVITKLSWI